MCGLIGYAGEELDACQLASLLQSMIYRGPDGEGTYHRGSLWIGMRRLAVIDLPGGQQPLLSREGRVAAFQNGEIYNYRELRAELETRGYAFKTNSDTEVLAHGYDAWAIDGLLRRLDGMYAIAIHDQDTNELHVARDRFGEKPLFYCVHDSGFAFGSTLLAVSAMPWVSENIDMTSLDRYLATHFVPGRQTILRDVKRVLPGERLTVQLDRFSVTHDRYYVPQLGPSRMVDDDELTSLLEHAVRSRLIADVPVGVFLSGGVDSSTIAAIASRSSPHIATFSMGFDNTHVDESAAARQVANHIESRHHEFIFDRTEFEKLLVEVAAALDEPVGDQAMLPLFWLSREVRKYATVVLSGEGADEIFAGYNYYQTFVDDGNWRMRLRALLDRNAVPFSPLACDGLLLERSHCTPSGFPLISGEADRAAIMARRPQSLDQWESDLFEWLSGAHNPLQRACAADLATWLADDLLVKADRMTMAQSIEGRAPYLSPALVETALNLPASHRMTRQTSKIALRRVAARYLPKDIVNRRKQGFVLPMRNWLEKWFSSHDGPREYFLTRVFPGVDSQRLADLVAADVDARVQRERLLFALVMLVEWWGCFRAKRSILIKGLLAKQGMAGQALAV